MPEQPLTPEALLSDISEWEARQRQQGPAKTTEEAEFEASVDAWRKANLFSLRDLADMPPQAPLIHGNILFQRTTAWLAGMPGTYKSFVALDWAMCIATGRSWLGREVEQGRVLYIAGEGASGMWQRANAWLHRRGLDLDATDDAIDFKGPTDLLDQTTRMMLSHLASDGFWSMVVVDTQARVTPGVNENAKEEMDPFIRFITHLAADKGSTVLTVHHATKDGANPLRGSGSILGAADSVFVLTKEDGVELEVELKVEKQKETETGEIIPLTLVKHRFEEGDRGESLVIDNGFSQQDLRLVGLGRRPDEETVRRLIAVILEVLDRVGPDAYTRTMLVRELREYAERIHLKLPHRDLFESISRATLEGLIYLPEKGKARLTALGASRLSWARAVANEEGESD